MGYYIQAPTAHDKADFIVTHLGGMRIARPNEFGEIPQGKALIVVVDNGFFEAAAFAYNEREFMEFTRRDDPRFREYVLIDWDTAVQETGYIPAAPRIYS